jgi:DNA-binding NarL/FixJ family response regulator
MAQVVLVASDLGLASRLQAAATTVGVSLAIAPHARDLPACLQPGCTLVLVNLAEEGIDPAEVVRQVRAKAPSAQIVAFGPHVDKATLAAAEAAGCDQVLSRGQFHQQYVALLQRCLNG